MRAAQARAAVREPIRRRELLSFAEYAAGAAGLAAISLALGLASIRLRAHLLPAWTGAPARLAEAVLGLALVTILLQLLGVAGQLAYWPLVLAAIAIGTTIAVLSGRAAGDGPPASERHQTGLGSKAPLARFAGPPSPAALPSWFSPVAIGIAVLVAAHWATGVQASWASGMSGFDTMWYHGPFAARFAQEGSITALHFTDPEYLHWFYPQNSELLHAAGIVLFDHDLLSPLINLGWLGLALLAAWCIGRPYGVAPLSMLAVAVVLDTNTMVPREAGNAANDIAPIALLLASASIVLTGTGGKPDPASRANGGPDPSPVWGRSAAGGGLPLGPVVVAGLAAGLAIGTKLTMGAAIVALTIGVVLIAARGARIRTAAVWIGAVAVTGGFWFVRNLFHAGGNPVPWLADTFSFLPGPERGLEGRDPFSVAHYLLPPDGDVFGTYFLPSLDGVLGPLWPAILALAAAGAVAALLRGRTPAVWMLGAVAAAAAIGYAFTPLTASGPEGQPDGFAINLRYLVPSLALGLALLPLDRSFSDRRVQIAGFAGFAVLLATVALYSDSKTAWQDDHAFVPVAIAVGILVIAAPVAIASLGGGRRPVAAALAVFLAATVLVAGWIRQDDYLGDRYAGTFRFHLETAFRWANEREGTRIALAGTSGAFQQYGLYGDDLSNHVQFVGRAGSQGSFDAFTDCAGWMQAVNEGDYDFLVTTPGLDLNYAATALASPEAGWVRSDPAAVPIARDGRVEVFRLDGELDPSGCLKA